MTEPAAEAFQTEPAPKAPKAQQARQDVTPPKARQEAAQPKARQEAAPEAPLPTEEQQAERPARKTRKKEKKKRSGWAKALRILVVVWVLEMLYFIVAISNIPLIAKWRTIYIQTAMETMSHQWLATYFFPESIVAPIRDGMSEMQQAQTGMQSSQEDQNSRPTDDPDKDPDDPAHPTTPEEKFYDLFWELDRSTMNEYINKHPEVLDNGWENIDINEAGLDDEGTQIYTMQGEQVLAIDAKNQILLVRVKGAGYRGVLAIAKDAEQLHLYPSANINYAGQYAGDIAAANSGVLAMTGSGFIDPNGTGNGGTVAGYAMCDGVEYGNHYAWGYKRIELHENNRFYIMDAQNYTSEGTTDAMEFTPALIIDGQTVVDEYDFWNGINPRACIGQSDKGEILMMVIEGRSVLDGVVGTGVVECARILSEHNCQQAINLDGGSSAIMWYDGEYVNRCSNGTLAGRPLPNAWVYTGREGE